LWWAEVLRYWCSSAINRENLFFSSSVGVALVILFECAEPRRRRLPLRRRRDPRRRRLQRRHPRPQRQDLRRRRVRQRHQLPQRRDPRPRRQDPRRRRGSDTRDPRDETRGAGECGGDTRYSVRFHRCTVEGDWENTQGTADAFCATPSPQLVACLAGALRATPSRHGIGGAPHPRFADDSTRDPAPHTTIPGRAAAARRQPSADRAPRPAL
jgi:hypothetical protein